MSILGDIRERLSKLRWKNGLNRDEMRKQWRNMPSKVYDLLPTDYRFGTGGEVMSYFEHLLHHGIVEELDLAGKPPPESVHSTTLARMPLVPHQRGVGSGTDPGYTGGGSVDTGVGPGGTTYGDTEGEELVPEEIGAEPVPEEISEEEKS
ncbi:MAG: hypothetical protein HY675_29445 [Chloroflexi bacterium]|nr:hypothetical protein [Chloroflexota bacterium]